MKLLTPTVRGWLSGTVDRVRPMTNSFHAAMKVKITAVTTPGMASGGVTRSSARPRLSPSIMAASSYSSGMAEK